MGGDGADESGLARAIVRLYQCSLAPLDIGGYRPPGRLIGHLGRLDDGGARPLGLFLWLAPVIPSGAGTDGLDLSLGERRIAPPLVGLHDGGGDLLHGQALTPQGRRQPEQLLIALALCDLLRGLSPGCGGRFGTVQHQGM